MSDSVCNYTPITKKKISALFGPSLRWKKISIFLWWMMLHLMAGAIVRRLMDEFPTDFLLKNEKGAGSWRQLTFMGLNGP